MLTKRVGTMSFVSDVTKRFRLALAGGGTGGHLMPGVHLLRWFEQLEARPSSVLWFTAGRAIEERVLGNFRSSAFELERVALALEPKGGGAPSLLRTTMRAAPETLRVRRALVAAKSQLLLGLGGYTSLAPILAARSLGLPIVLLEINAVRGRATRTLGRFAETIVHAWPASVPAGQGEPRQRVLGAPLDPCYARAATATELDRVRAAYSLDAERPLVLVLGGSQGAGALNTFVAQRASAWTAAGFSILHQVGPGRLDEGATALEHYHATEYVDDVASALGLARVALARGGASTLAEIAARRVPACIVPYPHHKDQHQEQNALALGAGVRIVRESSLDAAFSGSFLQMAGPEGTAERARMSQVLAESFDSEAGRRLAELVTSLSGKVRAT